MDSDMRGDRPFVGRSVTRLEDRPLVVGQGRFAAEEVYFIQNRRERP